MSTNKEILDLIRQLNTGLTATIEEASKNDSLSFFKESIKFSALSIFEKAQLLNDNLRAATSKVPIEIKIIKQEAVQPVQKEIPVQEIKQELQDVNPLAVPANETPKPFTQPVIQVVKEIEKTNEVTLKNKVPIVEEEDTSFNAKIGKVPVVNVADKLKDTPIKELVKAISISKKFEFINALFNGNAEEYKKCLQTIENSRSYDEASVYIDQNISNSYNWRENEALASEFFVLVKRRFL